MEEAKHYHMFAVCRDCGPRLSGPAASLDDVRSVINSAANGGMVDDGERLTVIWVNPAKDIAEIHVDTGSEKHEYILSYINCDKPFGMCAMVEMVQNSIIDTMNKLNSNSDDEEEDKSVNADNSSDFGGFNLPGFSSEG